MVNFKHLLLMALRLTGVNAALSHYSRGKVKTLIYHNVLPNTAAFPYALTPAEFERQMVLVKEKYNPVHLDESGAIVGRTSDRVNVLITLDDGFINNYEYVFPILVKHGLKATFFLIVDCVKTGAPPAIAERYACAAGWTGAEYRTVSLLHIREMMAAGMTFGSHTFAHTDFTKIELADGISLARESAERLSDLLGCNIKMFAFPWGRYRPGQPEALADSFSRIFTTDHGFNRSDDVVMRRDEALNDAHLEAVLSGSRDLLAGGRDALANAWRRIAGRQPRSQTGRLPARFGDESNPRTEGDPNSDEPKPLIVFVLPDLGFGGAEMVNVTIARQLAEKAFRVEVMVGWDNNEAQWVLPREAGYVVLNVKRTREMLIPIVQYLRRRKPAAIVASMWPLTVVCALAHQIARSKARLVVWEHSHISSQYLEHGLLHGIALKWSIALTYPAADVRIAVSQGVADDIAELSGIERSLFSVLYNPMTLVEKADDPDSAAATERAWRGWTGPRILTVGYMKPAKDHALLIRGFRRLLDMRDARLMIVGDGELREKTLAVARQEGVADKVFMPGVTANPVPFYRSSDLFVLSSDREGFGNVLVEALACGLPVISTNCKSGPAEILANGRFGRLVPIKDADALGRAMDEELSASHDREKLRSRAADFAPSAIADKFLQLLFAEAATRPSGPPGAQA